MVMVGEYNAQSSDSEMESLPDRGQGGADMGERGSTVRRMPQPRLPRNSGAVSEVRPTF